jgi:Flp pilus assembly protein TadB
MAQTRRKRKHRGTQAGTIEARGRTGRRPEPREAPARKRTARTAREARANRFDTPPTWRSALNRAAISAAIFAVAVVVIFGRPVGAAVVLGAVLVLVYLPMSYYTDRFLYNRRQRQKQAGSG